MQISVTVVLGPGDNFAYSADNGANQVLVALGGNPATDHCTLTVQQNDTGKAGTPPTAQSEEA